MNNEKLVFLFYWGTFWFPLNYLNFNVGMRIDGLFFSWNETFVLSHILQKGYINDILFCRSFYITTMFTYTASAYEQEIEFSFCCFLIQHHMIQTMGCNSSNYALCGDNKIFCLHTERMLPSPWCICNILDSLSYFPSIFNHNEYGLFSSLAFIVRLTVRKWSLVKPVELDFHNHIMKLHKIIQGKLTRSWLRNERKNEILSV